MIKNSYEAEIIEVLEKINVETLVDIEGNSSGFFARLQESFPISGSKIMWEAASIHIGETYLPSASENKICSEFFDRISSQFSLTGRVSYAGDNLTEFVISASIATMSMFIGDIFEIPQHHYFMAEDYDWCHCFSMERCMDFGINFKTMSQL